MFCGILAGNTIVYFMNRYSMQAVFLPSYCWTPAGAGIACGSMAILGVLPEGHALDIYILSILTSLVAANSRFLLARRIWRIVAGVLIAFVMVNLLLILLNFAAFRSFQAEAESTVQAQELPRGES